MKANDWLDSATKKLESAGVASARLDALILLEDATGKDRAWLLAHPTSPLQGQALQLLNERIERRANHVPLAYIRGKSEFFGREFKVSPATLQPRPETETMVELFIDNAPDVECVIDVGTGSGAIAITIKLEKPSLDVSATDINQDALSIAKKNDKILESKVDFYKGNLLEPLPPHTYRKPSAILANLPYVPNGYTINKAAMQEPRIAIFGGEDGLSLYREMFSQISRLQHKPIYILTESLPFQHGSIKTLAENHGYKHLKTKDLIQVFTLLGRPQV